MTKRLFARGSDGVVCIVEGGSDDYINNPKYNLDKVHFHSELSYMRIPRVYSGTVTFPYRTAIVRSDSDKGKSYSWYEPEHGAVAYPLAQHGLGYIPSVVVVDNIDALAGNYPIQQHGLSLRNAAVTMDTQWIYILERYVTYQYDLGSDVRTYKAYVFENPI